MLPHSESAVYRCITPVKKPFTASSMVYHSLFSENGEQIYPAWPDIDDEYQLCCLPFLMRAIYSPDLDFFGILVKPEESLALAAEYISRSEIMTAITPEIGQQTLALLEAHQEFSKYTISVKSLSELGDYLKKGANPSDARNACIEFIRAFSGKQANQTFITALHGFLQGNLNNFPGAIDGDFTNPFSLFHEVAHCFARNSHSGIVLERLSERTHNILYTLAAKRLSRKRIVDLWEQFWETNMYMIHLAKKFELIEEIFATFLGMNYMPPEVRGAVKPMIDEELNARSWGQAYKDFIEACINCRGTHIAPTSFVFDAVCRMLEQVDIDGEKILKTFAQIRKVIRPHIIKIEQDNGKDLDESKLEAMAGHEAAEEVNQILDQAGIPRKVYYLAIDMENNFHERINRALITASLPNVEDLGIFFSPFIMLKGKPLLKEISPLIASLGFQKNEEGILSLPIKVLCESLRQQISRPCGLVCPFAYKGKPCCGKNKMLLRLYERLPEDMKANLNEPTCDLIRWPRS